MATQQKFDFLDLSEDTASTTLLVEPDQPQTEPDPPQPDPSSPPQPSQDSEAVDTRETDRERVLRRLRSEVGCIHTTPRRDTRGTWPTGSQAIDGLLPHGGLRPGTITEWVAEAEGCGAAALSMITAATLLRSPSNRGPLVVVNGDGRQSSRDHFCRGNFYPPAAVALGISPERIIWVKPTRHADLVWAIDQALRCESVTAVWAPIGVSLDDRDARRFQLAAETGNTAGLFVRPVASRGRPSFAEVRFHVANPSRLQGSASAEGRVMQVTLDRCRGGVVGQSAWVQIDDQAQVHSVTPQLSGSSQHETAALRLASELAHPETASRKSNRQRRRRA